MSFEIPPHIEKLKPFKAGKPISELQRELNLKEVIKLASNENPLGPPKASTEAMRRAIEEANRYPDDSYYYLTNKISQKYDVPTEDIIVGAGSTDVIICSARSFLGSSDYAIIANQTFPMYWIVVQSVNGNMIRIPLHEYTYDLDAMADAIDERVKLVFIANPNNPTGTMVTAEQFDKFMSSLPPGVVVVYDEAYKHYVLDPDYPDPIPYYRRGDNIIILNTFSKIFGLAGLRIGYGIAKKEIIDIISRVRCPFNVSSFAAEAAEAALGADDHVETAIKLNQRGMKYVTTEMKKLGLNPVPSVTNFLLLDVGENMLEVNQKLLEQGVIVRPMTGFEVPTALRISIGMPDENEKFINALKKIIS